MNMAVITSFLRKAGQTVVKNAPHLLMGIGTVSSVSAVIFAAQATPAAKDAYEKELKENACVKLTVPETVKACGKYYIPAISMEALSLFCFWAAHGIDIRRQAVLSGLCATAQEALREYQHKVRELIGDKAEKEVRNAVAQDVIDKTPVPANTTYYLDGTTERWFIYRGQRFRSTYQKIKDAQNDANHEMIQNMYISELEVMWLLDPEKKYLVPSNDSGQVGWSVDNLMIFDIGWGSDPNHEPVGVLTVYDKDGRRYDPSPGFSRLL